MGKVDLLLVETDRLDHARHLGEPREILMLAHAARGVDAHQRELLFDGEIGGRLELFARHDAQ